MGGEVVCNINFFEVSEGDKAVYIYNESIERIGKEIKRRLKW